MSEPVKMDAKTRILLDYLQLPLDNPAKVSFSNDSAADGFSKFEVEYPNHDCCYSAYYLRLDGSVMHSRICNPEVYYTTGITVRNSLMIFQKPEEAVERVKAILIATGEASVPANDGVKTKTRDLQAKLQPSK